MFGLALAIPRLTWGATITVDTTYSAAGTPLTEDVLANFDSQLTVTLTYDEVPEYDISAGDGIAAANVDVVIISLTTDEDVTIAGSIGAYGRVGDITNTGSIGARTFNGAITATSFTTASSAGVYTFNENVDLSTDFTIAGTTAAIFKKDVTMRQIASSGSGAVTFEGDTVIEANSTYASTGVLTFETKTVIGTTDDDGVITRATLTLDGGSGGGEQIVIGGEFDGNISVASGHDTGITLNDGLVFAGNIENTDNEEGVITVKKTTDTSANATSVGVTIKGQIGTDGSTHINGLTLEDDSKLTLQSIDGATVISYIDTLTLGSGSTLAFGSDDYNIDIDDDAAFAVTDQVIDLADHNVVVGASPITASDATEIKVKLSADDDFGSLTTTASTNSSINAEATITPEVDYLLEGSKNFAVIATAQSSQAVINVADDTAVYGFTMTFDDDADDHILTVTRKNIDTTNFDLSDNAEKVGAIIDDMVDSLNTDITVVADSDTIAALVALQNTTDKADFEAAVESLAPDVSGGVSKGTFLASTELINTVDTRLSGVASGVSSGDHSYNSGLWMKAYGSDAQQDSVGGIDGFDAKVFGTAIGFDTRLSPNFYLGVAAGFADIEVDIDDGSNTDTTSYSGIVYSKLNATDQFYAEAFVTYSKNSYESTRKVVSGQNALGEFDGDQYGYKLKLGYDFNVSNVLKVTPLLSVHQSNLTTDAYTETGTSGFNLAVDKKDSDMLKLGFGLELDYKVTQNFVSTFRILSLTDSELEQVKTTSSFTGIDGDTLTSAGSSNVDKSSILAGFGLTYLGDGVCLTGNYNYETKDHYKAHSYDLLLRVEF